MKHDGVVYSAQFSPNGKWLLTASEDNTARLWDVALARIDPRNEINSTTPGDRQGNICRKNLIGAQAFDNVEMRDPILFGRDELRNPCERIGWFGIEYYWQLVVGLWK